MLLLLKLLRGIIKGIASQAAPWQIVVATLLGVIAGFVPVLSPSIGPGLLGLAAVVIALLVNCHLGSFLAWFGVCTAISKLMLLGPAIMVGDQLVGIAHWAAYNPLASACHLNHTGHLGNTVIAVLVAPLAAWGMYQLTVRFRAWILAWQEQRRRTAAMANVASTPWLVRIACWFFGVT
ncbi:MAG: hypothetical protein RLZZ127_1598 [Planctomycetota bacterium]|jgi:hypothetical protein